MTDGPKGLPIAAAIALAGVLHAQDGRTTNVGVAAACEPVVLGSHVLFVVDEAEEAGADLNGDGDATDLVYHHYDHASGSVTNLGVAMVGNCVANYALAGHGRFHLFVDESSQAQDLNADGDQLDRVLHEVVLPGVELRNLGVECFGNRLRSSGSTVVFTVGESAQGGADLNGDGDALDTVAFVRDVVDDTTVGLGLACRFVPELRRPFASVLVSEQQQGVDLNADGDTIDDVVHVLDLETGATVNLGRSATSADWVGGSLVFASDELSDGVDHNGDGDAFDRVLTRYDAVEGRLVTHPYAVRVWARTLGGVHRLAFTVPEDDQFGQDLNGDGDVSADEVLHVLELDSGVVTNTGITLSLSAPLFVAGRFLGGSVSELWGGGVDLNGDGDAIDRVAHVYDLLTGEVTNLGLHGNVTGFTYGLLGMTVDEAGQSQDLNGDGDQDDSGVVVLFDPLDRSTFVSALSVGGIGQRAVRDGPRTAIRAREVDGGGVDLNGDGDGFDTVLHLYDHCDGGLANLGVATGGGVRDDTLAGRLLAFRVDEAGQGGVDRNGDGDALDRVLHVFDVAVSEGSFHRYGRGLGGSGGFEPRLRALGCPVDDGAVALDVVDGLGGAMGWVAVGTERIDLPFLGGSLLVGSIDGIVPHRLAGEDGAAGVGSALLDLPPLSVSGGGGTIFAQAGYLDPLAPRGVSLTQGLAIRVGTGVPPLAR